MMRRFPRGGSFMGGMIGSGIGGGGACDFSTFFNGTSNVDVDFVKRAPLNIDTTGVTNDAVVADINFDPSLDEDFSIDTRILEADGLNDLMVTLYNSSGSEYIRMQYLAGAGNLLGIQGHDGSNYAYVNSDNAITLNQKYKLGFKLSGVASSKLINNVVDGVTQVGTGNLDFSGIIFDKIVLGTSETLSTKLKMLLFNMASTQLGTVDFVSNVDDGLTFISSIGDTYIASDETPLTIQYPDYTPSNSSDIISTPATGPLDLVEDSLSNMSFPSFIDLTGDWSMSCKINISSTGASSSDRVVSISSSVDFSAFTLDISSSGGSIRCFVKDSLGVAVGNLAKSYTPDIDTIVTVTKTGTTVVLDVNGSITTDTTVDLTTNGCDLDQILIGGTNPTFRELPFLLYYFNFPIIDNWNFISRLPTENDTNGNEFTGSVNGIVVTLQDDTPFGTYFPYYTEWNDSYLVSDKQCAGNDLIIVNGIAITDEDGFAHQV